MKATGILDGYEHCIEQLISNGWPSDKNIFEHAAYELLRWHSDHKDEYANINVTNPGAAALVTDRKNERSLSPGRRNLETYDVSQEALKYPEVNQLSSMEKYKQDVSNMNIDSDIRPI